MSDKKISELSVASTPLSGTEEIPIVQAGATKKATVQDILDIVPSGNIPANFVFVDTAANFPAPVGNVITLADGVTYFITDIVDLNGARIVSGQNTVLIGGSSENCGLKSTGLVGTALITSQWSIPIRNISIFDADIAVNLDANGNPNQAIDWFGVNFTNCTSVGRIANYNNFIMTDSALLNSAGMEFDGTFGTIGFIQCLFNGRPGLTTMSIASTANITRRFRAIYSSFVCLAGETALDVDVAATVPVESYILDTVNFSGGGTYIAGVQYNDNKALFVECKGILNSASIANYYMQNNAVVTDIITQGVAVKVAGATTPGPLAQKFSFSDNRATYIGAITRNFKVSCVLTVVSGAANKQIGLYIAKNDIVIPESEQYATTNANSRAEAVTVQAIVELSTNNYIEIYVENDTDATDVTVTFLNVIIEALN